MTSTGVPTATLSETGALPAGVTFTDNGDGTATLAGTPADQRHLPDHHHRRQRGEPGRHPVLHPDRRRRPGHHLRRQHHLHRGAAGTFTVTTTGYPDAGLSEIGPCPAG